MPVGLNDRNLPAWTQYRHTRALAGSRCRVHPVIGAVVRLVEQSKGLLCLVHFLPVLVECMICGIGPVSGKGLFQFGKAEV